MNKQRGFTLIELVVVIIILGVLAAVAVPKFVDMSSSARNAAAKGVAGAIASATSINYAARQTGTTGNVQVNAANVCTDTVLQQFVEGGVTLVTSAPASPNDSQFVVSGTGACNAAQASATCTISASHSGATPNTTIVYCAR